MTALMTAHKVTRLRTGRTCERCGYWAQAVECQRENETGERCALPTWAKWYCGPLAEAHQGRKAMTRKDEYALYVASAGGPALDKLAKKLAPARKRAS